MTFISCGGGDDEDDNTVDDPTEIELNGLKFYTHSGFWGTQVVYSPKYDISFSVNYSKGWIGSNNAPLIHKIFDFIENQTKP